MKKSTKLVKNRKIGEQKIITTTTPDSFPIGFIAGRGHERDANEEYVFKNALDACFNKVKSNAKQLRVIAENNEFNYFFTLSNGATKDDFDNLLSRLKRVAKKLNVSEDIEYVYAICWSYAADMHIHGFLKTDLTKKQIKSKKKNLNLNIKSLGLYVFYNQDKIKRYIADKNLCMQVGSILHPNDKFLAKYNLSLNNAEDMNRLKAKQEEILKCARLLNYSGGLITSVEEVIKNPTPEQIQEARNNNELTYANSYDKYGSRIEVEVFNGKKTIYKNKNTVTGSTSTVDVDNTNIQNEGDVLSVYKINIFKENGKEISERWSYPIREASKPEQSRFKCLYVQKDTRINSRFNSLYEKVQYGKSAKELALSTTLDMGISTTKVAEVTPLTQEQIDKFLECIKNNDKKPTSPISLIIKRECDKAFAEYKAVSTAPIPKEVQIGYNKVILALNMPIESISCIQYN